MLYKNIGSKKNIIKISGNILFNVFLGKFEEHEDIPCTHLGEKSEWLTCWQDTSIAGSSYIYIGNTLGLIIPRPYKNSSELFLISYGIKQMPHPKEKELNMLNSQKEKLQVHTYFI